MQFLSQPGLAIWHQVFSVFFFSPLKVYNIKTKFQAVMTVGIKMTVFWDVALCVLVEVDISEVLTAFIIGLMLEAASTFEMSVTFFQNSQCSIPEDSYVDPLNVRIFLLI
jgi:hypothetical protein